MAQLQRLAIAPSQLQDRQIILTAQQQHYLYRVLRLREGDRFLAMDGRGHCWLAELAAIDAVAVIQEEVFIKSELNVDVTLMVALPKGNGFDDVVRQAVELGVYCIIPVVSDRTLLKPSSQKIERWRRIAAEAAEQSERQIVPVILEPVSFAVGVENCDRKYRYICVARGNSQHLLDCLLDNKIEKEESPITNHQSPITNHQLPITNYSSIVIATGPEGGWTEKEVKNAIEFGFQPVSLGSRILRAVTAPIVALSIIAGVLDI
ncbi:16S rRNA (uracil(1498)-N(3))-methyltransferase [Kamptonema animale CS-326]|jgi:16S rRNA (uracil1498-N3)-methyltransferase|uniref:16S rRNA (uracil(1498)-N(3))-methyltransferase n=1 Tax=Kamptonema animale TaxID=92934 RepID=UPI00232D845A|nr:16S rRNA (uracil(1498)-N(3))-methyltransferase [Kamptonema animale]MDB9512076.1 16S rRNA (uracil(1498)-N(3))-methyltransferase [Kamptonema animale CS-326]